jgi:nucleoside-diphosphate-sugar epimerase
MKVLVTGASGFIGSHLLHELKASGYDAHGTDKREGHDLAQPGRIELLLDTYQPDVVVHLAAKYGRLPCEREPAQTVADNALASTLVARACANLRVIYVSSSEIYGDHGPFCILEGSAYRKHPHNLYGLTKRWGEEVFRLYCPDLTVARGNMIYGPGQQIGTELAALPNFLRLAQERKPILVHRGAERSWCYITDFVSALRLLVERGEGTYNVGRDDDPRPMREIAEIACRLTGAPQNLVQEVDPPAKHQTVVKRVSMGRLRKLGWKPQVGLEAGMAQLLETM